MSSVHGFEPCWVNAKQEKRVRPTSGYYKIPQISMGKGYLSRKSEHLNIKTILSQGSGVQCAHTDAPFVSICFFQAALQRLTVLIAKAE